MRRLAVCVAVLALLGPGRAAFAEIGTVDAVPAATLLLPYFEVDLDDVNGVNTLFSVNNASATAVLAQVTLWTDQAIPTFGFTLFLTGYDVQTINVRDIFNGVLPVTADDGADPADTINPADGISNQGVLSQDINFPGSVGPCGSPATLYNAPDPTLAAKVAHIRASHTGQFSSVYGGCSGSNYGDNVVRGYITVDTVNSCPLLFPSNPGYFSTTATFQNVLWGDYFYVNPGQNFAQGDNLVHVEACIPANGYIGYVGNGAGHCPFVPGDYTFYGRYVAATAEDQREPLATTFASRYLNGGVFSGGTDLLVWRDTKLPPIGSSGTHSCFLQGPLAWFPLLHADAVAFNESEDATNLCFLSDNLPPAIGGDQICFPLAAQRVPVVGGNLFGNDLGLPYNFGWIYLNLNTTVGGDPYPGVMQNWVTTVMASEGRFSVGFPALQMDNALTAVPGGVILPLP